MKHINITNWKGNITDWTKFNYIYGGLDDTLADRVNLRIPGTNLRNYIKKSDNLIQLRDTPQADYYGLNYKIENGVITVWGTATQSVNMWLSINAVLPENTQYYVNFFHSGEHEGNIIYNVAKEQYNWTDRVITQNPSFTFQKDYSMSAICLQFDANKQYNCTFKPMIVYGNVMPTTYEPYGSMVLVENVDSNLQPLDPPKITVSRQAVFDNSGVKNWTDRPSYNAADRFVLNWNLPRGAGGFTNWNGFNYIIATGGAIPDTFSYVCNNNGSQIVINFSAKGTTTLEQFKEYISNHPLIITYFPPNTNTLSMASPMQLDKTNVEEDIEYLEDTKFNEEILSEEE